MVAYQKNLNTHKSYRSFRDTRASLRKKGDNLSGLDLVDHLESYAQTGKEYVKILRQIILQNNLTDFDNSILLNTRKDSSLTL